MLKEFVDRLVSLGRESQTAKVVRVEGDPYRVYIEHAGQLREHPLPASDRQHEVLSVEDLVIAANSPYCTNPVIWHCDREVVLLPNDDLRRDSVTFPLLPSLARQALAACDASTSFSPKELSMFLRTKMAECHFNREIIGALRKLKWQSKTETRMELGQGRESVGRDIEAELQTDIALPEEIAIEMPVYQTIGEDDAWTVRCLIEPNVNTQRIIFCPIPGQIESAINMQQASLRARLQTALPQLRIIAGQP